MVPIRRRERGRRVKRVIIGCILIAVPIVLAFGFVLAMNARSVKSNLEAAQADFARARAAALSGDQAGAQRAAMDGQAAAGAARAQTSGAVWSVASHVPVAGDSLRAVDVIARESDVIARRVLPLLLSLSDTVRPAQPHSGNDRMNLAALDDAAPKLEMAQADLAQVRAHLSAAAEGTLPAFVASPLGKFRHQVDGLSSTLAGVSHAAQLLPPMLGYRQTRRYFVAFQNPAEARGTGGLVGAFGIAEASNGRIRFSQLGTDSELRSLAALPVDLGRNFRDLYGEDPALWSNANESPHFPYAARLWLAMWQRTHGQRLDGVVTVDPLVLSYILRATGPVTLPTGEQITTDNVVRKTLSDAYARYTTNSAARKRYLLQVSSAVVARLLSSPVDTRTLLKALARGADERRLLVYSQHSGEERVLANTSLAGALPARAGPYAFVVVNNSGANKLDYYLERHVTYSGKSCSLKASSRETRVTVTLRTDLSSSTKVPADIVGPLGLLPGHRNDHRLNVALYGSPGSTLVDLTLDGRRIGFAAGREESHPVFVVGLTLPAGAARELVFDLSEPSTTLRAGVDVQPLVRPQVTVRRVPECHRS